LRAFTSGVDRRERELAALTAPEVRETIESHGIRLRSFATEC